MRRGILIYRRGCRKCRLLSLVAVVLALGTIRRLADDSAEAAALDVPCGERGRLKLTLVIAGQTRTGAGAVVGIPLSPLIILAAVITQQVQPRS
jgi:hypothetical protein